MAIDERAKTQERWESSNVRPFIPRAASSAPHNKEGAPVSARTRSLSRDRNVIDDDDDPGPSAA